MKLNKLQRHTAYIIMLEEKHVFQYSGFCWAAYRLFKIGEGYNESAIKKYFPEIYAKKPETDYIYWFPTDVTGWNIRLSILKQCIKETA